MILDCKRGEHADRSGIVLLYFSARGTVYVRPAVSIFRHTYAKQLSNGLSSEYQNIPQ